MAEVKWIKLATEMFDNRKIRQIECLPDGDGIIVIWFKLLCLAGNINDCGMVYFTKDIPYTEQMLATQFNRPLPLIQLALKTFQSFGMIEIVNDILYVSNWEKYQNVDRLNELREYNRIAQRKSREKKKLLKAVNDTSMTSQSCQGTDIDIEVDKDIEEEKKESRKKATSRFIPPTLDEVKAYCIERNNNVDAEQFIDFYTSKGWKVGRESMKDWKAAVRTWEKRKDRKPVKQQGSGILDDYERMKKEIEEGGIF